MRFKTGRWTIATLIPPVQAGHPASGIAGLLESVNMARKALIFACVSIWVTLDLEHATGT